MNKLGTYLHKAVPDMRLTIKKYANAKFEYLAYCLKIKEMDDEEYTFNVSIIFTVKFLGTLKRDFK